MKRLIAILLSFPLVLGSAAAWAQPAQSKPSHEATTNRVITHHPRKRHSKVSAHKGTKRAAYRPEYKENSVEVINGNSSKKVVFNGEQQNALSKNAPKGMKTVPSPMRVEVMNGASTDTRYFYDRNEQVAAVRNRQVVIGVQSSNTRTAGGNQHPVVTSVNSAEAENAKGATNNGQPVTNIVSPRPKRPEYQPDVH